MRVFVLSSAEDLNWCRNAISDLTIRYHWADCRMEGFQRLQDWRARLENAGIADVIICDITIQGAVTGLKAVRAKNQAALVVPIASSSVPPSAYVCPDILPFALLWEPLDSPDNYELLYRVLSKAYYAGQGGDSNQFLSVRGKRETRQIPFNEICYFEAKEKRVFVRLREQEIPVNETISSLEEHLPAQFFRCHKGFLVNQEAIETVDWSRQLICLKWELEVPLSRGYRAAVKERVNGVS